VNNWKKTLEAVKSGQSDANIGFSDACILLQRLGYSLRKSGGGSHRIFTKPGCAMLNIQNRDGKVTPYQVKQIREQISQ